LLFGFLMLCYSPGGCAIPANGPDPDNQNGNDHSPGDNDNVSDSIAFAVIGDYGDSDDDTAAVAAMIRSWSPDFIITTGDNDYSDGAYRGTFEGLELAVGQYFHEFIGNYQGDFGAGAAENRFFPTPGDHDWGDTCDDPAGLNDYLAYFTLPAESSGNERYYAFRRGPVQFFSIHSLEDCEPDGVTADSAQGQWVRQVALASDAPFQVAYFHNPPYSSGDRHIGEGAHMRWPWNEWGIDLVLSGDDHIYERLERDEINYIVNGLGGVDRHSFVDPPTQGSVVRFADAHGAMRVRVSADTMEVEFVAVNGTVVDSFSIESEGNGGPDGEGPPGPDEWFRPSVAMTWQWQLQPDENEAINTSYDVDVYDIDLFDAPESVIQQLQADGRKVICYFSAGSYEDFRDDADEFLPADLGNTLEGFADERWLDIRSANVRRIMRDRLDQAVEKGCDGVEPDNVTGFENDAGFDLTAADQLDFNRFLADEAHARGLGIGLKNDLGQIEALVADFDFAVNEQCHEFDECDVYQAFIGAGKPVFNAEYLDEYANDESEREALCSDARARNVRTLVVPVDLDDSFRFTCDP